MESCLELDGPEAPAVFRRRHCCACAGSGACLRCEGWGKVWSTVHGRSHCELCPDCSGVGACKLCGGRGRPGATVSGLLRRWLPAGDASH
jgi:hypothetical protein